MKHTSSSKAPKRNANTSAVPYAEKNIVDKKSQQKFQDDFLQCTEGTFTGVYLTRT